MKIRFTLFFRLGLIKWKAPIKKRSWTVVAIALTLAFWIAFIAVPILALIHRVSGVEWDSIYLNIAWMTFKQAGISTVLSGAMGLLLGLFAGEVFKSRIGGILRALLSVPFGIPTVVAGTAWVAVLGRHGILAQFGFHSQILYTFSAVVLAHVFFNAPWVAWWVGEISSQIPSARIETARSLGAGRLQIFLQIRFPAIALALGSALVQVFALCTMSFALVLILGGGPPVQTLEVALYSRIRLGELNISGAVVCGLLELVLTLIPWFLLQFLRRNEETHFETRFKPAPKGWAFIALLTAGIFLLPYIAVFNSSSLSFFKSSQFWLELSHPAWISLIIALGSASLALGWAALGAAVAQRSHGFEKIVSFALGLPTGVSVLVFGLGFWLAYSQWIDPFSGSLCAIIAIQGTLFLPLAFRLLWPQVKNIQKPLLDSAQTLGASPLRAFMTIEWPRLKAPVLGIFSMVAGASLGEVAAVSLFYSENLVPLPLLISRAMAQYQFEKASAVGALLLLLAAGSFLIASHFSGMSHEQSEIR